MLVASTPCGSGYIHTYLLYYIATCAISTILDTHYVSPSITVSICMIFFCSSLSPPPLLGFSFDQHFGSSSVHVTAGVHIWLQVFTQTPQCFTTMWYTVLYNGREFSVCLSLAIGQKYRVPTKICWSTCSHYLTLKSDTCMCQEYITSLGELSPAHTAINYFASISFCSCTRRRKLVVGRSSLLLTDILVRLIRLVGVSGLRTRRDRLGELRGESAQGLQRSRCISAATSVRKSANL